MVSLDDIPLLYLSSLFLNANSVNIANPKIVYGTHIGIGTGEPAAYECNPDR